MDDSSSRGIEGGTCVGVDVSSSDSESSSVSYNDESDLVRDLQELLCDSVEISDTHALVGPDPPDAIPLHTQILCSRTTHFATALRPPWRQDFLRLSCDSPEAFRDILEFIYTGAIRLELDTGSSVGIAAAADFTAISELEKLALAHIDDSLTPSNFSAHVKAALSLPSRAVSDGLVRSLSQFAARYPARILTSAALSQEPRDTSILIVRSIWLLLAYDVDACYQICESDRPVRERSLAVEGLLAWSRRHVFSEVQGLCSPVVIEPGSEVDMSEQIKALACILDVTNCDEADRASFVSVFMACSARTFATRVEPLGLLSESEVLVKYRRDATCAAGLVNEE